LCSATKADQLAQALDDFLAVSAEVEAAAVVSVDLDILLFGEEKISESDLEIPHPRMKARNFVLTPLLEIAPDVTDPWGTPLAEQQDDAEGDVALLEPF
jgi:7,8-dihydro-6-hydroxymethylpterin-pyrophosphokinase